MKHGTRLTGSVGPPSRFEMRGGREDAEPSNSRLGPRHRKSKYPWDLGMIALATYRSRWLSCQLPGNRVQTERLLQGLGWRRPASRGGRLLGQCRSANLGPACPLLGADTQYSLIGGHSPAQSALNVGSTVVAFPLEVNKNLRSSTSRKVSLRRARKSAGTAPLGKVMPAMTESINCKLLCARIGDTRV